MSIRRTRAQFMGRCSGCVRIGCFVIAAATLSGTALAADTAIANAPEGPSVKQLQALDLHDAREFAIYRDSRLTQKLELRLEPVYTWTNVIYRQNGSVFVWTC